MRCAVMGAVVCLFATLPLPAVEPAPEPREKPMPRTFEPDAAPQVNAEGAPVRTVNDQGFRLEIDLSPQVVSVYVPERTDYREDVNRIEEGDTITVSADGVALRAGQKTIAPVRKGQRLVITKVQDAWLNAAVTVGGEKKTGWLHRSQAKLAGREDEIHPTLSEAVQGKFVSAAILTQKSKQFDDGLYAAVELAAQNGAGELAGKTRLLQVLANELIAQPPSKASSVLLAALQLGGQKVQLPAALEASVQAERDEFLGNPLRSKPLGFYTWSRDLTAIFQQDRMLQTELPADQGVLPLVAAIQTQPDARATYERYLRLVSKLTNPWEHKDLRGLLPPQGGELPKSLPDEKYRVFPPSTSHENALVMKLGDKPIPEGFDLMNELIARIRSGQIDLTPTPDSGWYDHQTYSLEPLVQPEKTPEAKHLSLNDEYKKLLTELFKGALALARETHVKQMDIPAPGAAAEPPEERKKVFISLELSAEPLATHYFRRAESYKFIRGVLEEAFGSEALNGLRRQTADGPVEKPLGDELAEVESLFRGAAIAVGRQIGAKDSEIAPHAGDAAGSPDAFLKWAANLAVDGDLSRDSRMMVPVFFDRGRQKTKVWVFLGWSVREISFGIERPPAVKVFDKDGNLLTEEKGPEVYFTGRYESLPYPVMAEVYVNKLLDRDEFRRHCDAYLTRSAILANLQ